tara:strand:- start:397 stop:603 length:207 start_codon:yes stop_codon:yes gene_type:complete
MTERSLEDVYSYYKQSLDLLEQRYKGKEDHPNYKELRALLIDQVNDELYDYGHSISDRGTGESRKGSD